jgi:hypothetical protein
MVEVQTDERIAIGDEGQFPEWAVDQSVRVFIPCRRRARLACETPQKVFV